MAFPVAAEPDDTTRGEAVGEEFRRVFRRAADFIARAPGRINLIGEHTDYNGGFVLPAAIDRTMLIACAPAPGSREVELYSLDYCNSTRFSLDDITPVEDDDLSWSNYVRGVAWALIEKGLVSRENLVGAQMALQGNVPQASGLSSSAAIEVASALALTRLAGVNVDRTELALACQYAENRFIGVNSGIMDQFISALGDADSALLIDTRSLEYRAVPLALDEIGCKLVAVDSAAPRTLATTAYNQRRAECEEAMRILAPALGLGEGAQLRDIGREQLNSLANKLPDVLFRRARHVVSEDERTLQAVALMGAGLGNDDNLSAFGVLLYASHESLRDDYEVSSDELDLLVALARGCPGVVGARMTGAGFGGCTVNIVSSDSLEEFNNRVVDEYRRQTRLPAKLHICRAVEGGSFLMEGGHS